MHGWDEMNCAGRSSDALHGVRVMTPGTEALVPWGAVAGMGAGRPGRPLHACLVPARLLSASQHFWGKTRHKDLPVTKARLQRSQAPAAI